MEDRDVGELGPSLLEMGVGTGVDAADEDAMRVKSLPLGLFAGGAAAEAELELLLVRSIAEAGVPAFGAVSWDVVMVSHTSVMLRNVFSFILGGQSEILGHFAAFKKIVKIVANSPANNGGVAGRGRWNIK